MHEGQAVRITGEGEAGENGARRAICTATSRSSRIRFSRRHNNDLVCQVPISFTQAALGGKIEVPTLKGREELDIPAGTQHGEVFKLKGKGLPDFALAPNRAMSWCRFSSRSRAS